MKTGGGLVENVKRAAGLTARKFASEFCALGFAAGKGSCRLAKLNVTEAHIDQRLQFQLNRGNVLHHFQRIFDGKVEQVGDGIAFVTHGESLGVIAFAAANFTSDVYIGQEIHFDSAQPVSLARFAATALHVEAEPAGTVAAFARFGQHGKDFANGREDSSVGGRVRTRRAAYGRLVDLNDLVNVFDSFDSAVGAGLLHRAIEFCGQRAVEDVIYQCGFSRARNSGYDGEQSQRKSDIDVLQIIAVRAENYERFSIRTATVLRDWNRNFPGEVLAGKRVRIRGDFVGRSCRYQMSAGFSRTGAEIHHIICATDGFLVMFDDKNGIAEVAQSFERTEQAAIVTRVQADRRFVEHVKHSAQARADLRGQAYALGFATRKSRCGAIQGEVTEANV